jgi:hypothetical protein
MIAFRRRLRSRRAGIPLFRSAVQAARHSGPIRSATSVCFATAEALRTEAATTESLRSAIALYRAVLHGNSRRLRLRARERLLLMLCQLGAREGSRQATSLRRHLRAGGFACRLTSAILRYPLTPPPAIIPPTLLPPRGTTCALDGALPTGMLHALQRALSPSSPFWAAHGYRCTGLKRSPFFSYVHDLEAPPRTGFDRVLQTLLRHARASGFPRAEHARYAEWWAHCRPHGVGHQLHFDSDDEGQGGVRNPLVSSALYLSDGGAGGPTLVTDQTMGGRSLARRGWLMLPAENRYLLFDGRLLHGVVPGRGGVGGSQQMVAEGGEPRRVSLMVAFWHSIVQRPSRVPAAAMPFPDGLHDLQGAATAPSWLPLFDWPAERDHGDGEGHDGDGRDAASTRKHPATVPMRPVQPVWEPTEGGDRVEGMPEYEQCFQGLC